MPDKPGVPMTPPSGGGGSQGTPAHPGNKGNPPVDRPWEPDKPGGPVNPPDTPIGKGPDFPFKPGNPPPPSNPPPPEQPPQKPREPNPPPPSEKPGTPGPPLEPSQDPGTGGDFSKGQPYGDVTGPSAPTGDSSFYGDDGFDPYFGRNTGINAGGGATSYDPLGIGKDAYTDPNADVWSMTGVNSVLAPGSKVKPRYGVVGGNGGYGYGMVGQDYSGPLAGDPRELVRGLRQQRRQMNRLGTARPGGPGGHVGGPGTPSGPGGWTKPGVSSSGDDMNNWKGQPAGGSGGGGATGGAGTTTGGQGGKWGAPPPAAGANTGGASPEPGTGMGPSTSALDAALPGGAQANGTPGKPGMIWWNGVEIPNQQNYTDQFGNITTRDAYAQQMKDFKQGGMGGMMSGSMFKTKFGDLVQSSGGNSNVYKVNGQSDNDLYHYDPKINDWKHMTADEYRGYGDYNYFNPLSSTETAKKAGAQSNDYWYNGGGNATAAWNPNPNAAPAPDKWDKRRQTGSF